MGRRSWEEDYVLKQSFPALVPAFDPRPGRSNISQIQNFEVPPPGRILVYVSTNGINHGQEVYMPSYTPEFISVSQWLEGHRNMVGV